MKHTQGKWKANQPITKGPEKLTRWESRISSNTWCVATARGDSIDECMANAQLIAAAPGLLEALKATRLALRCSLDAISELTGKAIDILENDMLKADRIATKMIKKVEGK